MPLAGNHQIYSETYSIADFLINDSYSNILWKVKTISGKRITITYLGNPYFSDVSDVLLDSIFKF